MTENIANIDGTAFSAAVEAVSKVDRLIELSDALTAAIQARDNLACSQSQDEPTESEMVRALNKLQDKIGQANADKGFHEESVSLQARISGLDVPQYLRNHQTALMALIVTEAAEGIEQIRKGRGVNETYYSGGVQHIGRSALPEGHRIDDDGNPRKPEGVPSELADIVIRTFDFAARFNVDLVEMIFEKLEYNETREQMHGKKF